ncbi:MAG: leucine--tRNA ligase [candidate division NC10 bacterium]|nr:leucine--tRNA ligase [candidate division NC10 bacterium]
MARGYNFKEVEERWQRDWEVNQQFRVSEDPSRPKYYLLEMYPYPSGKIHMGHVRNYSIGDVVARYKRMRGYNVLHPMGWDAFGLPAENAALEHQIHPAIWTDENIRYMRKQLKRMGFSYDWDREVASHDPQYYKWNQWFFLQMFERGLAYKKGSLVNWCDSCQTVLANEQVEGGLCWRCETPVRQKELDQWFLKITQYSEELLRCLDSLTGWPDRVKVMQRNWIGKSEGVEIRFPFASGDGYIPAFTTRADTLFGATFLLLAPEHPLALRLSEGTPQSSSVRAFLDRMSRADRLLRTALDTEKEGCFTGSYAIHPLTQERIPVWIANYVLMEYGTGAIMAVPAHDQRDLEFARKYDLPIRVVIQGGEGDLREETLTEAYVEDGTLVHSGPFDGLSSEKARQAIAEQLEKQGSGGRKVAFRLRDWGISRQRYWGTPIPIIYCDRCGTVPVPYPDLPVLLPHDVQILGKGESPLSRVESFVKVNCPQCAGPAQRETDTMDTFVDSSWYFLRFLSPHSQQVPVEKGAATYWMPVDQYIGGIEHAVMHLLYARFFTKFLRDLKIVQVDEPFTNLLTQGMVIKDGAKMSKSKGNVVDPDDLLERYGADTARLFSLFAAPPEKDLEWSEQGVEGSSRFLNRVWRLVDQNAPALASLEGDLRLEELTEGRHLFRQIHRTIQRVTEDIEDEFHFNTAISALMELVNQVSLEAGTIRNQGEEKKRVLKKALETILLLLSPFAPHICEELWRKMGHQKSIFFEPWPTYEEEALAEETVLVVVQIDGRVRHRIYVAASSTEEEVKATVLSNERVKALLAGREIQRMVLVPNRLLNIVLR